MIKQSYKREILTQAWEDWSGLWEAAWGLRSEWKDLTPDAALTEARAVLKELLAEELIYVCWLDPAQNETRMSRDEAEKLIDALCWEAPPTPQDQYWFATTKKGDERLTKLWVEASS